MNRRNFISICQQIVVGCALGVGLVKAEPKFQRMPNIKAEHYRINPNWVNAPYELRIAYFDENCFQIVKQTKLSDDEIVSKLGDNAKLIPDYRPIRLDKDGNYITPLINS